MTDQPETPRLEVTVAAAADVVWKALRDPELIRRWHGWDFEGLDEEIRVIYLTGVTEHPGEHVFEVQGGDRFSLHPAPEGTIVTVTRAPRGSNPEWDAYYDDITEGWRIFLEQLRFAVERHGLSERRTIIFDGALADGRSPADALGLAEAAALPPGAPYRAPATTGEELSGTVWARSPGRLVLTVEGVGDGLLVLTEQPSAPHRPAGGVLVLLTTYGLDDAAFGRVEARWTSWWEAHRAPAPAGTPGDGPEDQHAEQHASQPVGQNTE